MTARQTAAAAAVSLALSGLLLFAGTRPDAPQCIHFRDGSEAPVIIHANGPITALPGEC